MKKIKILIDARCVGGEGQGVLTYIKGLYTALYEKYSEHYELFFAGYQKEDIKKDFPFVDDEHFISLPKISRMNLFLFLFPRIEKKYKIDYSHFQYVTPFRKKSKHIVTTHDVLFLDFWTNFSLWYRLKRKYLFKKSLERSDIRLTVSNYSKNRISEWFNIPQKTISITPNAVHPKFFSSFDKTKVQKEIKEKFNIENYILLVSRIERRKNQDVLLEMYKDLQLAKKGIQLVLVGNNTLDDEKIASKIISFQKKYPNKIHWLTYLNEEDLMKIYQAARVFVYPSRAEGFGIPPIEAAALGIETLCSNQTAMQDFSFFENNLKDPNNYYLFKNSLKTLLQKTPNNKINTEYRNQVKMLYSWDRSASVLHQKISMDYC